MRRSIKLALILVLSTSVIAGAFAAHTYLRLLEKPIAIRIAEPSYPAAALLTIAARQGYFRKNGLAVEVVPAETGKSSVQDVTDGRVEFGLCAVTPFVRSVLNGQRTKVVTGIAVIDGGHEVAARRERGIHSVRDLVGKRIALPLGTGAETFLGRLLDYYGMKMSSVHMVDTPLSKIPESLDDPNIDAVCTFQDWNLPSHGLVRFTGEAIFTLHYLLVSRDDVLQGRPEVVERLLRSLVDADAYVARNRQQAAADLAAAYGIPANTFDRIWDQIRPGVSLDHSIVRAMEQEATWAMDNGRVPRQPLPDFLSLISFSALENVRPEAVNIVHDESGKT
ncbi:MAG: ABC transporter substrate-binding protein [Elusimicrobia bacterium]|nr:ABC transporter substrate-binding protein [Elusimicrobiota bacterium]